MIRGAGVGLAFAHARYLATPTHSFLSVDPMLYKLPQAYLLDPQQMNSYAYARNNPITYTDPTGGYVESALDVGFIAYDLNSLKNNLGQGNYYDAGIDTLALAADSIGLATPFGTGFGLGVRYAGHGGDVNKAFSGAKQMVAQAGPVISGGQKTVSNITSTISNNFSKGQAFENKVLQTVGEVKNTTKINNGLGNRIPDILNTTKGTIGEVKNTNNVYLTPQLKTFINQSQKTSSTFTLYVNEITKVSKPLIQAIDNVKGFIERITR